MRIFFFLGILFCCTIGTSLNSQTVGVIEHNPGSFEGYTFFSPFSGTSAYMVDNCGRLINQWDRGTFPGLSAYFLENGLMLRTYKVSPEGPFISASNAGGLELVDWDNHTVWFYEWNTPSALSHHDAVMMPNGNILMLTWELITEEELIQLGRDPNEIDLTGVAWNEKIVEIRPIGSDEINVVWEWRIRDHYIQDFDPTKENFGVVAEHPELFDINLPDITSSNSHSNFDFNHFNSIDYNEDLDQILISVRNSDEIWILDHSTTTAQAAGHTGGNSGKGGDILYRYGNANAYDRGPVSAQKLFGQHGANWIPEGLPDAGKILIYNNGNGRPGQDFSEAEVIVPPTDSSGHYIVPETDPFGPQEPEWSYGNTGSQFYYSPFLSNAQRLPNGNTLINAGSIGNIFEVDLDKNVQWHYIIPLNGNNSVNQGSNANNNGTFRAYRYGLDYPGFEGLELTPGDVLENDNNPAPCQLVNTNESIETISNLIPFQFQNGILSLEIPNDQIIDVHVFTTDGRTVLFEKKISGNANFALGKFPSGIYLLNLIRPNGVYQTEKLFLSIK